AAVPTAAAPTAAHAVPAAVPAVPAAPAHSVPSAGQAHPATPPHGAISTAARSSGAGGNADSGKPTVTAPHAVPSHSGTSVDSVGPNRDDLSGTGYSTGGYGLEGAAPRHGSDADSELLGGLFGG